MNLINQNQMNIEGIWGSQAGSHNCKELPIITKVNNLIKWKGLPFIMHVSDTKIGDNLWIVTARVSASNVNLINDLPFVITSTIAEEVFPMFENVNYTM